MKTNALWLVVFSVVAACESDRANVHIDVSALQERAKLQGFALDLLAIHVSGRDMADQVTSIAPDAIEATLVVPAGSARTFTLEATHRIGDGTSVAAFAGEAVVAIVPGPNVIDLPAVPAGEIALTTLAGTSDVAAASARVSVTGSLFAGRGVATVGAAPVRLRAQVGSPTLASDDDALVLLALAPFTVTQGQLVPVTAYIASRATRCHADSANAVRAVTPVCRAIAVDVTGIPVGLVLELRAEDGRIVDTVVVEDAGASTFANGLPDGERYSVVIRNQPAAGSCVLTAPATLIAGTSASAAVACTQPVVYADVLGLTGGATLTMTVTSAQGPLQTTITKDGIVALTPSLAESTRITASIGAQPGGSSCVLTYGGAQVTVVDSALADLTGVIRVGCAFEQTPVYINAANHWNRWVIDSEARDARLCTDSDLSCRHVGWQRKTVIAGLSDCDGVSASDTLGSFVWTCIAGAGEVQIVATDFAERSPAFHYLRGLLNNGSTAFRANAITVTAAKRFFATQPLVWWDDAIVDSSLARSDAIIVERGGYGGTLARNDVSLVSLGALSALSSGPALTISDARRVYVEVDLANAFGSGVEVDSASHIALRGINGGTSDAAITLAATVSDVHVERASLTSAQAEGIRSAASRVRLDHVDILRAVATGVAFEANASDIRLSHLRVENASDGITTLSPLSATDLVIASVAGEGIVVNADGTAWSRVIVSNAGNDGIAIFGRANTRLSDITVIGAGNYGIESNGGVAGYFENITVASCQSGLRLEDASTSTVVGALAFNNAVGIDLQEGANDTLLIDTALLGNDIGLNVVEGPVVVAGTFVVSSPTTDCRVNGASAQSGIYDGTCTASGANGSSDFENGDAVLRVAGAGVTPSFVGNVTVDANPSAANGTVIADVDTDWVSFDNRYRAFALPLPARGNCADGDTCQLYDLRLTRASIVAATRAPRTTKVVWQGAAVSQASCDAIVPGSTFDGSAACYETLADGAIELSGAGDGVCNGGDTCMQSSNIGSYAGEGAVSPAGAVTLDGKAAAIVVYAKTTAD